MVAMNPQTWDKDVAGDRAGRLPLLRLHQAAAAVEVPRRHQRRSACRSPRSATRRYTDPRAAPAVQEHHLRRRALGAARHRARGDRDAARRAVQGQGQAARSRTSNALQPGPRLRAARTSTARSACGSSARDEVGDRIFIDGNSAAALGCVYGGATVCAWYPITPSSSLAEAFSKYCQKLRVDPATGKNKFAIVQAEDELASIGMVDRRRLERRARVHRDLRPRHLADAGVHRPRLFRRDPGRASSTCSAAARRPACRRARSSPTCSRCAYASHGDTKHVLLFPEDPTRVLRVRRAGVRPRRPAADAGLRHARPRHRHERLAVRAVRSGTTRARYDRGKVMTARGARGRQGFRPLPRRRRRRHPVPHLSRHAPEQGRVLHARHDARTATRATREEGPDYVDNMQRLLRKFETAKDARAAAGARRRRRSATRFGVDLLRLDQPGDGRGAASARERGHPPRRAARARASRSSDEVDRLHRRARPSVFVVEQNRDAQLRTLLVNEARDRSARLISVLHYDGTPITARFIIEADRRSSVARRQRRAARRVNAAEQRLTA